MKKTKNCGGGVKKSKIALVAGVMLSAGLALTGCGVNNDSQGEKQEDYSIAYDLNGGTGIENTNYVLENDSVTLPTNVTRAGYVFDGWYLDGSEVTSISKDTFKNSDKNSLTIKAKWSAIDYAITYNLDNGKLAEDVVKSYTVEDEDIILPTPTKAGYVLDGWLLNGSKVTIVSEDTIKNVDGNNIALEAKWLEAFTYSDDTKTVITGLTSDASNATEVVVPKSVTTIYGTSYSDGAFAKNTTLQKVIFEDDSQLTSIGDYAFWCCSKLACITIPNSVISIGRCAFGNCYDLTSVVIEEGSRLSSVGDCAFDCPKLQYNTYDNAEYLGNSEDKCIILVKAKSKDITSCEINEECKVIYHGAFSYCSGLTSITIPNSVISIEYNAFSYCSNLTSITIPASVTNIGESAFQECSNMVAVTFKEGIQLKNIGSYTFSHCSELTSITIPVNIVNIGKCAFSYCSKLESVFFEKGSQLISIQNDSFVNCSSLTSITIPNNVKYIGNWAFQFSNLTSVYYLGSADEWSSISIGSSNTSLTNATRYYYSETEPTDTTNKYWHYDSDGNIVVWTKSIT